MRISRDFSLMKVHMIAILLRVLALAWILLTVAAGAAPPDVPSLSTPGLQVETFQCNCTDRPTPHYPYTVLVVKSRDGELLVRPEGQESVVTFTPLALRYGDRYCEVDASERCFGNFAHPCEFTDFRYGPTLAPFFPSCKEPDESPTR